MSNIKFERADPKALAAFDPRTKICTMNCGPHRDDPRSHNERLLLCGDCLTVIPGPAREVIAWHDAATSKPDSDMTVLCWGDEGFFCGYWDDSIPGWIGCESGGSVIGVTHWSNPNGPGEANHG